MAWIGDLVKDPDELKQHAAQLDKLAELPERATRNDIRNAAAALLDASNDIRKLLKYPLPGCPCRRITDENYDYLVYTDACQHHAHLKREEERIKAAYTKAEEKLKENLRTKFMAAALSEISSFSRSATETARRAREIADATITALLE
jgi:hypothetical protein